MKKIENLEKKLEGLKEQNRLLKEEAALLKKENILLKADLNEREKIFHSIPMGIMLVQQGRIIDFNETMLVQLGYQANEISGHHLLSIVHTSHKKTLREILKKWETGNMPYNQYETYLVTGDGSSIYCSVSANRIRVRNRISFLLAIGSLEQRKEIEDKNIKAGRHRAQVHMAEKFGNRLRELAESFLAGTCSLQSEKKNPGHADSELIKTSENTAKEALKDALKLDIISAMEKEYSDADVLDLNMIITDAVTFIKKDFKKRAAGEKHIISTYLRASSTVKGNRGQLKTALLNLITNSIEAMPDGGELFITAEENEKYAYVYIQDSGNGIPKDLQDRVFEPFFSTGKENRRGLGLSLSNAVIKRHGGDLELSSDKDQGAVFQIKLPLYNVKNLNVTPDKNSLKSKRILIIHDKDVVRELIAHQLNSRGCTPRNAENGLEGLAMLKRKNFNMVIADTASLGVPGGTFIKRCGKANSEMIIIMIRERSGSDNPGKFKKTDWGLDIIKPIDINRLTDQAIRLFMNNN